MQAVRKQRLWVWYLWVGVFYSCWALVVWLGDHWATAVAHWPMAVAMLFGSYVAGSTPMGGGTVGFPILVLLFDQPTTLGRDFSFAIQSVGMTSASIFILARRQPIAWAMLAGCALGALIATPLGVLFLAPRLPELGVKLTFAVAWASFGLLHLRRIAEFTKNVGMTEFNERWDFCVGFVVGWVAGGTVASVTGVGIDMLLYSALVLISRADLKIAIPTSVLIMAFTSLVGLLVRLISGGLTPGVFENWLAAAPIVCLGAPLGALVVNWIGRAPTLYFVSLLCLVQFGWTCMAEREALGITGIIAACIAVVACLLIFERLRRHGERLISR